MQNNWYKNNDSDKIWWLDNGNEVLGQFIFSFDQKKKYNMFADYPYKLTKKEIEIFNEENPFWVNYFKDRLEMM